MKPFAFLALLPILLSGCGGSHKSATDYQAGDLGTASIDLALAGNAAETGWTVYGKAMRGTGTDSGSVSMADPAAGASGALDVYGTLNTTAAGEQMEQTISLHLVHSAALAKGASFTLGGESGYGNYSEAYTGGDAESGVRTDTRIWHVASGTATVSAISGGRLTVSLSGVTLSADGVPTIVASGTVSGSLAGS